MPSPQSDTAAVTEAPAMHSWKFYETAPTQEQVRDLVATLRPVHGVSHTEYLDYVQALPSREKYRKPVEGRPGVSTEDYVDVWVLYMSVAGRLAMLNDAAALNLWRVDFTPEPNTPSGAAGFLADQPRIVYREHIEIWAYLPDPTGTSVNPSSGMIITPAIPVYLGRRTGQAAVPFSGGSGAAGTNPIEKVETSARGRALAGWGFGVFPGSGIASLEEMQGVIAGQAAEPNGERAVRGTSDNRKSREELLEEVQLANEQLRQLMGATEQQATENMGKYLSKQVGASGSYDPEKNEIDWGKVKNGQLVMVLGKLDERRKQWAADEGL